MNLLWGRLKVHMKTTNMFPFRYFRIRIMKKINKTGIMTLQLTTVDFLNCIRRFENSSFFPPRYGFSI